MNVGSLFSGVGGIDLGLERAGHRVVFQCEADPYRRRVLARHWPGVPCFEDVRSVHAAPDASEGWDSRGGIRGEASRRCAARPDGEQGAADPIDLLCGGFPCQDLSVAGRRAGFAGERSSLFFECARVADALLPAGGWLLIENVPGLLSSNGGRDFGVLLATLAEIGFHDLAWRVLDSRYLGVPQRRRRVFILARRSRGRRAAEVLLEPESGGGDFEAGREAGPRAAASLSRGSSSSGVSAPGRRQEDDENIVNALDRKGGGADDNDAQAGHLIAHTLRAEGFDASEDGTGRGTPLVTDGVRAPSGVPGRMDVDSYTERTRDGVSVPERSEISLMAHTGRGGGGQDHFIHGTGPAVDRCALDPKPDGPRYAACGDAVTVNVAEWIGRRLAAHTMTPYRKELAV